MGLSFLLAAVQHKRMKRSSRIRQKRRPQRQREIEDSNTLVAPEIPLDLLIEILTRLPAKSVMRFKCISKFLSSLLCSRYFCNLFLTTSQPQPQPRLYMFLLDRNYYSKSLLLSSAPSTYPSSPSVVFDQDLTIREMGGYSLRSVRGFICFTIFLQARIYNPSTKQLVILPAIESNIVPGGDGSRIAYFICYDPVNDQYKILCTMTVISSKDMQELRSELWVLILEAGGLWKRVAKDFHPHLPIPREVTINGVLYYLAWTDLYTCVLMSFDIRSEEFNMIQVPRKAGDVLSRLDKLLIQIDYCGKVAVFDCTYLAETGTIDLWVVEDWRKKEWSSKTLVLQPSQMHLLDDNNWRPKVTEIWKKNKGKKPKNKNEFMDVFPEDGMDYIKKFKNKKTNQKKKTCNKQDSKFLKKRFGGDDDGGAFSGFVG